MLNLYTMTNCSSCLRAANFLKENKVRFNEINITNDLKSQEEIVSRTGQIGVPVFDVNGVLIVGFNKNAISYALGIDI
jgi:glutaredoxin 3